MTAAERKTAARAAVLLLAVFMLPGLCGCGRKTDSGGQEADIADANSIMDDLTLSPRPYYYPSNIVLGQDLSELRFQDKNGAEVVLSERLGSCLTILCYWGSWCPHCEEQLAQSASFAELIAEKPGVAMLLVDKLDPAHESVESAERYLEEKSIPFASLYDGGMAVYDALGMKIIPTTYFLDAQGRILFCRPGAISSTAQLESMISYVENGFAPATEDFIVKYMLADGGMRTSTNLSDPHPSGDDVLSESQGLLMEYAVEKGDKALFDACLSFLNTHMYDQGLYRWYYSEDAAVTANALIDDIRIFYALMEAEALWGGYGEELETLKNALVRHGFNRKGPVDFFDMSTGKGGGSFSLCYGDLKAIKELYPEMYGPVAALVEGGYISDGFPLYYSSYSYADKTYSTDPLHTAEAMYTLLHLAEEGRLKESSVSWLREHLAGDGIMAGYQVDGTVAQGKGYESTGIYAIAAMIGMELGDGQIVTSAVSRMEAMRIFDSMNAYDGAFGNEDGTGIYSFDQCMGLLAFQRLRDYLAKDPGDR